MIDPKAAAQFDQDGFVVIADFFDAVEMGSLRAGLDRFVTEIAPRVDLGHVMYEDPADPASLKQADCLSLEPALDRWRWNGKVRELAESLIGPVAPQQCEYFSKPAHNNKPTPPHQDGYYFCLKPNVACTVWIPLDMVDHENGALSYVRGSHQLGVLPHRATETVGFSQGLIPDPGSLGETVLCAGTPGTVMVHHSLTVHSAGANTSGRPRRSIAYVFFSASAEIDEEARSRYMTALQAQRESKGIAHNPAAVVV